MRQFFLVPIALLAAGVTWAGLNAPNVKTTLLVAGQKLDITRVKKEGTVVERFAGFHRITMPGSRAQVERKLKQLGAEFILHPEADTLQRSSPESRARHDEYLKAVAKFKGLNEEYATATFKESIDMEIDKRSDENGYIDFDKIRAAQEHRDRMPVVHIGYQEPGSNAPQAPWKHLGPFAAQPPFQYCYGSSTLSGRKEGIAVAKSDSNTIWTVGRGGAYKSTDGGSTWKNMSPGWKFTNANCVAIDPVDKNIVYVGTGDYADGGGYGSLPFGIMKTTDGGLSWTNHGDLTTFDVDEVITDIVIAPWNRTELFCTTRHGNRMNPSNGNLFRSTNSGLTWSDTGQPSRGYTDMTVSIGFTFLGVTIHYIYAAAENGTVIRTSDGTTWTVTGANAGSGYTHIAAGKLALNTLYAVSAGGIKKSTDRGDSWVDYNSAGFPTKENGGTNWAQMTYNSFVGVTKIDGDTEKIWVGNLSCATRTNDSTTWTDLSKSYWDTARGHADHHSFANDPNNDNRVYIGTDGGIYRNLANSTTMTGLNNTFGDFQCYSIDVHPTLPDFIMAGMQDNAVMATRGNLNSWQGLDAWDGGFVAFDKVNPKIHYTSSQNGGVYRYTQDFQSNEANTNITPTEAQRASVAFIPPITTVGTGSEILMGSRYILRYPGTGTTWTQGFDAANTIDEIATSGNTVFFGCRNGNVYRSTDKGSTATRIDGTIPATPIGAVYIKTTSDVLVGVMGTTGGLYRSTNAGDPVPTWTNVSGAGATALPASPINAIAVDPHNVNRWYVGTDAGLFMTSNAGSTWANCTTQGFPNACVTALKTAHGYLYAATAGSGVHRIKVGSAIGHQISGTIYENGVPQRMIPVRVTSEMDVEDRLANSFAEAIPDNEPDGIDSDIFNLTKNHTMVTCKVFVHISHSFRGDLQLDLLGPNGTNVRLKNVNPVDSGDDVVATYDVTSTFGGISSLGAWELTVRDLDAGVVGTLNTWSVIYTYAGSPTIAETMTNTSGQYAFSALLPGTYIVTPTKNGKVFGPQNRTVTMLNADIGSQNFNSIVPISLTLSKDRVIGGNPLTGAVRLTTTPPFPVNIAISDNSSATVVPATHQMDTIGPSSFNINTIAVASTTTSTISASYGGVTETDAVTVYPVPTLESIVAGPTPIYGGTQVTGTVNLAAPAPTETVVQLSGYVPDIVPTVSSVTIPQGQSSANFTANSIAVATPRTRYLKATLGSQVKSKAIFLEPAPVIVGWTFDPNPVIAGEISVGRVQLARPVVNAPVRVFLTDNSAAVSMPAFVDIPVGQTTVTFEAPTVTLNSQTFAGMYASFANNVGKKYVKLTIAPTRRIASFTFAPNPVQGGQSTVGTVVLAHAVINAPVRIYLSDNSNKFSMPDFIDIPVGQTTGSFTATTLATTTTTAAGCYASFADNVGKKYVKVTITP